jgi:hypothetical protein
VTTVKTRAGLSASVALSVSGLAVFWAVATAWEAATGATFALVGPPPGGMPLVGGTALPGGTTVIEIGAMFESREPSLPLKVRLSGPL